MQPSIRLPARLTLQLQSARSDKMKIATFAFLYFAKCIKMFSCWRKLLFTSGTVQYWRPLKPREMTQHSRVKTWTEKGQRTTLLAKPTTRLNTWTLNRTVRQRFTRYKQTRRQLTSEVLTSVNDPVSEQDRSAVCNGTPSPVLLLGDTANAGRLRNAVAIYTVINLTTVGWIAVIIVFFRHSYLPGYAAVQEACSRV